MIGLAIVLFEGTVSNAQQISITGGNLVMTVSTGAAGSEPVAVANTSDQLRYKRQSSFISKVTVSTSCPGQSFNLSVVAVSPQSGTAMPAVNLQDGAPDSDFIINIPQSPSTSNRTATLRYTASATFAQGNSAELGNDVHTVTYSIVAQ